MPCKPGCHLDYDDRCAIQEGLEAGLSASAIARRLEVSASTVTREVKANRCGRPSKSKAVKPARKCANYAECRRSRDVCAECLQQGRRGACRLCKLAVCADVCPDFEPRECPMLARWPYLCRCSASVRAGCDLPKFRYDARRAHETALERLSSSRSGISVSRRELDEMLSFVIPLIRDNGLSPEAIWLEYPGRFPVGVRTFYAWMEDGTVDVPAIYLPRKVRRRPRRKKEKERTPVAAGRGYADFEALPPEDRARAVEMDAVVGRSRNASRILSIHFAMIAFRFYMRMADATCASAVRCLDSLERALGSPEAFEALLGIVLTDRGPEFKPAEAIERSCLDPSKRRCRVFYCDALSPGQKGSCERNHEELRRILPKGRSDFDALSERDLAVAASHVSSYPGASLFGKCPADLALVLLPEGFLDLIGVEKLPLEEVVLKPSLLAHAVEQQHRGFAFSSARGRARPLREHARIPPDPPSRRAMAAQLQS